MNKKLNLPDEIWLGKKEYSILTDWKVNGWLFVATIISAASDIMFPHLVSQWHIAVRAFVALIPFLAILLWVRNLTQWIRGMDELHRRITLAAVLFTVCVTFFFVILWHRLEKAGVFEAIFPASGNANVSWDIGTLSHIFLLMTFSYFFGHRLFNRRYQ